MESISLEATSEYQYSGPPSVLNTSYQDSVQPSVLNTSYQYSGPPSVRNTQSSSSDSAPEILKLSCLQSKAWFILSIFSCCIVFAVTPLLIGAFVVFPALQTGLQEAAAVNTFVYLDHHTIGYTSYAYSNNITDRGQCLLDCKKNKACVSVVFDPMHPGGRCRWLAHAPACYKLTVIERQHATIYVKRTAVLPGELHEDGSYYWITHSMEAHATEEECKKYAEFYSLAIDTPETRDFLTRVILPELKKPNGGDAEVILQVEDEHPDSSLVGLPVFFPKSFIRVGDIVEPIGPYDVGSGLCKGEPFKGGDSSYA